jgi:hypothetical protein
MAVFRDLLRRWGFVKLERYGLVVTPDDRIVATRPVALDDGAGGRIVGWRDDDLAMAELATWQAGPAARPAAHVLAQRPVQFPARLPAQRALPAATAPAMPVEVAPEAPVDEDDWEWTIALARARAAEEPETASAQSPQPQPQGPQAPAPPSAAPPSKPAKGSAKNRTTRQLPTVEEPWETVRSATSIGPAPAPMPITTTIGPAPAPAPTPTATTIGSPSAPTPSPAARVAPATVIPVPHLPSILDVGRSTWLEPVVRTTVTGPAAPPNRLAKGTAPIDADTEQIPAMSEDTVQSFPVGDHTTPGVGMPLAARAVALPSIKRRDERRR